MAAATPAKKPAISPEDKARKKALLARLGGVVESLETQAGELVTKGAGGKIAAVAKAGREDADQTFGWKSMTHQLNAIKKAAMRTASQDELDRLNLVNKATGMSEAAGPDGGFLLAPQYVEGILEILHEEMDGIWEKCDKYEMSSPSMKLRAVDETSRADGSRRGGVLGYWVDEGGTLTKSAPKFRNIELVPHKVTILTYATEELLADAKMLEQTNSRFAAEELNFQVQNTVINGTGAGQPLGILNSACTISVSKETGQAAASVQTENIVKMWGRLHSSSRKNAIWFVNQDVLQSLYVLTLGIGTAGIATYMPPGGLSDKPYATLMGKEVKEVEYCATLGTVGDIILADLKQYIAATRGAIMSASSVHVQFLTDETAFKWTWRIAGMPWWSQALSPFKGSNTQSPFVTLATRA